jgi:hypothetical protein
MNSPFRRGRDLIPTGVVYAIPRIVVLWFAGALVLNATTTLLLASALILHLLGSHR